MIDKENRTQIVRILDVLIIGPWLIYIALKLDIPKYFKIGLLVIGILTIVYNLINFIEVYRSNK